MQKIPMLQLMRRGIRARVCPQCWQRPEGSEKLDSETPRSCEPQCTIFLNLPKLAAIAKKYDDTTLGRYERATQELICQKCETSPSAGDYCADRTTRNCPLSRYMGEVIDVLEKLERK